MRSSNDTLRSSLIATSSIAHTNDDPSDGGDISPAYSPVPVVTDSGAVDSARTMNGVQYPLEGNYAPLLPKERYKGQVLAPATAPQSKKPRPGLAFSKVDSNVRRVVVEGVDDIRAATAGLLARHVDELDYVPPTGNTPALPPDNDQNGQGADADGPPRPPSRPPTDFFSTAPPYNQRTATTTPPPFVDDRITPRTLHALLKKGRATAAKLLPPSQVKSRYYSFQPTGQKANLLPIKMSLGLMEGSASEFLPKEPSPPTSRKGGRPPQKEAATAVSGSDDATNKKRRLKNLTTKGETPAQFVKGSDHRKLRAATMGPSLSSPFAHAHAHTRPGHINLEDFSPRGTAANLKDMLKVNIDYLEPPGLTLAHQAKFEGPPSTPPEDGRPPGDWRAHTLTSKPQEEAGIPYPPVKEWYPSKESAMRAKRAKRMNHIKSLRQSETYTPFDLADDIEEEDMMMKTGGTMSPDRDHEGDDAGMDDLELDDELVSVLNRLEGKHEHGSAETGPKLNFIFTPVTRGDDANLVRQLVDYFGQREIQRREDVARVQQRTQMSIQTPTVASLKQWEAGTVGKGVDAIVRPGSPLAADTVPYESPFSFLEATLSVSREFEKIRQKSLGERTPNTAQASANRMGIIQRLTNIESSRIPEQYWVTTLDRNIAARDREQKYMVSGESGGGKGSGTAAQSHVLQPEMDSTSTHTFLTSGGLTATQTTIATNNKQGSGGLSSVSCAPNLGKYEQCASMSAVFPAEKPTGRSQVYLLAETLDQLFSFDRTMLATLSDTTIAHQILPPPRPDADVDPECEENNTLLCEELKKRSIESYELYTNAATDVVEILDVGLVEVVRQVSCTCVERGALLDALRQMLVDVTNSSIRVLAYTKHRAHWEAIKRVELRKRLDSAIDSVKEMKEEVASLAANNEELIQANNKLTLKATRLDELVARVLAKRQRYEVHSEEEHTYLLKELENDLLNSASNALTSLYEEKCRLAGQDDLADPAVAEAPSTCEVRKRVQDQKEAMDGLYQQSYQLLRVMNEATEAVNEASSPLYDKVVLKSVSPCANLAAARWAEVARAVGAFEKEKNHRTRVFQIFSQWCEDYRKIRRRADHNERVAHGGGDFIVQDSDHDDEEPEMNASVASYMSAQSNDMDFGKKRGDSERRLERDIGTAAQLTEKLREVQYITTADLDIMNALDCSPEEINAMFTRNFDFKDYLRLQWEPKNVEHQLKMSDVREMVRDVQATMQEITLRMRAVARSDIMKKGIQPPMKAPSHPEERCQLCGRRDGIGEERRRCQQLMKKIAREVQHRIEELTDRCQRAEAEREDARGDMRRLQVDLEQASAREEDLRNQISDLVNSGVSSGRVMPLGRLRMNHSTASAGSDHGNVSSLSMGGTMRGIIKSTSNLRLRRNLKRAVVNSPVKAPSPVASDSESKNEPLFELEPSISEQENNRRSVGFLLNVQPMESSSSRGSDAATSLEDDVKEDGVEEEKDEETSREEVSAEEGTISKEESQTDPM